MDSIGFDWPYPMDWLWLGSAVLVVLFALHARRLLLSLPFYSAIRLFVLRALGGIFFFLLISRPFIDRFEQDPKSVRILSLVDLSGSMHQKDEDGIGRRIEQVRAHMDVNSATSWINQARSRYGAVERLGFTDGELFAVRSSSWEIPEKGENTSIGNALANVLRSSEQEKPAALVLFSDGRSNTGLSALEVAKDFREVGIPVNVVGVGKFKESGNLSVEFVEAPREVMAKEELTLSAGVKNGFDQEKITSVSLFADERELEKLSVQLQPGELRTVRFSSFTPEVSGLFTYRVVIDSVNGDSDRSDDQDTQLIKVKPPAYFSVLYLSNQVRPLYPFLKRTLSGEQFQLSSLIRLGEQTFHARGNLSLLRGTQPRKISGWIMMWFYLMRIA